MNYSFRNCSSIAGLALLSACASPGAVTPQSRPMEPAVLDAGSVIRDAPIDEAPAPSDWWSLYGDPQLDALVARAVAEAPSLRIAADRISQAQSVVGSARATGLPSIAARSEFLRLRSSAVGETPPPFNGVVFWDNNIDLKLSYDLDLWGKNRSTWEAALGSLRAAQLDLRQARLMLQTSVVRTYLQLSYAYTLRDVLVATVEQRQQVLDLARRRRAAGLAPQLQVSQAEAEVAPVKVRLEQDNDRIRLLCNQLAALEGEGPGAGEALVRPQIVPAHAVRLPSVLPADLIGRRPDIVAARWRVAAAGKGIDAATAQFYPDVNLTAFVGLQALSFTDLFQASAQTYGAAPAISLPIFDGGRLRANLAGRTAAYDLAVDQYNDSILSAIREVADQLGAIESAARQREQADVALAASRQAYDEAQQGFRAGLTDFLTVLTTQTSLLNQEQERAQIIAAELDARALLMQALGGGFNDESQSADMLSRTAALHPAVRP